MSAVSYSPEPQPPQTPNLSGPQAEKIAQSIETMFGLLCLSDQRALVERLTKASHLIPATRAGEVLGAIVRFLPSRPEWTAQQIRAEVERAGVNADQRAVFNAIGYLAKKGSIQRLGGGRYIVDGVGIQGVEGIDECRPY